MQSLQVITLGCSKNTVDTEHLLYQVRGSYELVPEGEDRPVDILLINTCGFIGDAKEQSIQAILAAAERKKEGRVGRLMVFGCLSQRYPADLPELIPEVDGWFGARTLDPLVKALGCEPDPASAHKRVLTDGRHPYAFLKISEGCDRRCSYCAIPLIRGNHRSVPMEELPGYDVLRPGPVQEAFARRTSPPPVRRGRHRVAPDPLFLSGRFPRGRPGRDGPQSQGLPVHGYPAPAHFGPGPGQYAPACGRCMDPRTDPPDAGKGPGRGAPDHDDRGASR